MPVPNCVEPGGVRDADGVVLGLAERLGEAAGDDASGVAQPTSATANTKMTVPCARDVIKRSIPAIIEEPGLRSDCGELPGRPT